MKKNVLNKLVSMFLGKCGQWGCLELQRGQVVINNNNKKTYRKMRKRGLIKNEWEIISAV